MRENPKNTHYSAEFSQVRGAKHMSGCNKGARQREQNKTESEDLEKLNTDWKVTHCSARSTVSV